MSANLSHAETAHRAATVEVHSYRVDVDVRDARNPDQREFPVTSTIELTAAGDTWLDFIGEVDEVSVDGERREVEYDGARIHLRDLPAARAAVVVRARGRYSRTGEGLHRFTDPSDGETYLYTPWGKYDQIFVPEYNLGAMEKLVHEMSHMWFGDLVVPQWWGDLWLKESFAEFMGSHVTVEAAGFDDGWVNFASNRKVGAYLADSMPTTHPIVADIPDVEAAKTNFDRITYSKGSSALTQLVHYVGLDAFLAGCRRYFAAHAFGAASLADFIAALDAETDRDLSGWVRAWLMTAGHDTLSAHLHADGDAIVELAVRRDFSGAGDASADRPHATTVGLYVLDGDALRLEARFDVVVDEAEVVVPEAAGRPAPEVVLVNDLDQTFARVSLDPHSRATLLSRIGTLEPLARAVAWTALWTDLRAGDLAPADFITAVVDADERQSGVLAALLQRGLTTADAYSDGLEDRWREGCRRNLAESAPGSAEQTLWAKAYLRAAALSPEDVAWLLDGGVDGLDVSVEIRWLAWEALATQGAATHDDLAAALAADDTAAGRVAQLRALASRPDPLVKRDAWDRAHAVGGESNDNVDALLAGFNALGQADLRTPFAEGYFAALVTVWAEHPIEIAMRLVRGGFPSGGAAAGHAWLSAHPDAPGTLRRLIREAVHEDEVAQRVRSGANHG